MNYGKQIKLDTSGFPKEPVTQLDHKKASDMVKALYRANGLELPVIGIADSPNRIWGDMMLNGVKEGFTEFEEGVGCTHILFTFENVAILSEFPVSVTNRIRYKDGWSIRVLTKE